MNLLLDFSVFFLKNLLCFENKFDVVSNMTPYQLSSMLTLLIGSTFVYIAYSLKNVDVQVRGILT